MPLCPATLRAALHEEALVVTDLVREMEETSDHYALRRIPDGGMIDPHTNSETIIYGEARQPYKEYTPVDYSDKPLIEGDMSAAGCTGESSTFETNINDIRSNACSGECIIDFAQGFRRRGFHDFDIKPKTPIKCAAELAGKNTEHVRAFFKGFVDQFSQWGFDNFDANLLNFVIRYGGANASIQAEPNYFGVTEGHFIAPPKARMSVWFLSRYRLHMLREKGLNKNAYLEVEMPFQDAVDAIRYDMVMTNPGVQWTMPTTLRDEDGDLAGREFITYKKIKFYFNEEPVKGYFKHTGTTNGGEKLYQFVRIYPWINEVGEEGGVQTRPNHAYDDAVIYCEGVRYDLVILAFVINEKSFKRYGLNKTYRPGGEVASNNYEVKVIDGAYLAGDSCGNDYNEKFRLVARHQFRFTMPYPELSGAIAYLANVPLGYTIPVCNEDPEVPDAATASASVFESCGGPLACQLAVCEACGKTADVDGQCIDTEDAVDSVLTINPCGEFTTAYNGDTSQVIIRVKRSGSTNGVAGASYTITDTPGAGLATTPEHYVDVSDVPGTLAWGDNDGSDQLIKLNIVGGSGSATNLTFTITLASPTGAATLSTNCSVVIGTIEDHSV